MVLSDLSIGRNSIIVLIIDGKKSYLVSQNIMKKYGNCIIKNIIAEDGKMWVNINSEVIS